MDAATRTHVRHERSRLTMIRLNMRPEPNRSRPKENGKPGRPVLRDSHEAWETEVEAAIKAFNESSSVPS